MTDKEFARTTLLGWAEVEIDKCFIEALTVNTSFLQVKNIVLGNELESIRKSIALEKPQVVVIKRRMLDKNLVNSLDHLSKTFIDIGFIAIVISCNLESLKQLDRLRSINKGGFMVILDQSLTTKDQFYQSIEAVSAGGNAVPPCDSAFNTINLLYDMGLTSRELEVLENIAKGYTNSTIAGKLNIDAKTVRQHINNLYSKLSSLNLMNGGHPRVSAVKLFYQVTGQMNPNADEKAWQLPIWSGTANDVLPPGL
ncbi:MAG: LuxR C-terminal-related transcriptional regulator [Dehalococcoidales bacterium]|nr:LuxR C-terminal-related transcriptional regulator [Dehalococcoidales bacterium]